MDYPYFVFYLLLILFAFLYWKTKEKKIANCAFFVAFVFFGFRAPVVGADTWDYVRYLTGERNFYNYDPRPLEPLFVVYREILNYLTDSRAVVMVFNTLVTFAPLYYICKKYSLNPPLTVLFFCFLGGMFIYFVGLRQIIALAVLYIALIYCVENENNLKRKFGVFLTCAIVAYFFHTSSVIYALIILVALFPFRIRRFEYILLVVASALAGVILAKFDVLDFFSFILGLEFSSVERLDGYLKNEELNDAVPISILLRLSIFSLVSYFYMDQKKLSHPFSKIFLAEVIIYNLLYSVPMSHRLCFPLSFFGAVILTWTRGKSTRTSVAHKYLNLIIVLMVFYYLRSQVIDLSTWKRTDEGRMHPYYFVFENYRDHPSITNF